MWSWKHEPMQAWGGGQGETQTEVVMSPPRPGGGAQGGKGTGGGGRGLAGSGAEVAELCLLAGPGLAPAEGLMSDPSSVRMAPTAFRAGAPQTTWGGMTCSKY